LRTKIAELSCGIGVGGGGGDDHYSGSNSTTNNPDYTDAAITTSDNVRGHRPGAPPVMPLLSPLPLLPRPIANAAGTGEVVFETETKLPASTHRAKRERLAWSHDESNVLAALLPAYWAAIKLDNREALGYLAEAMNASPTIGTGNNVCREMTPKLIANKIQNEMAAINNEYVWMGFQILFTNKCCRQR